MLIMVASNVIYNAATGQWIRYAEENGNAFLLFYPPDSSTYHHRLTGEEATTAWQKLCYVALAQRQVLEHQHNQADIF